MSDSHAKTAAIERFLASYEVKDVETRISLFADDISFEDPVGAPAIVGRAAMKQYFVDTVAGGWDIDLKAHVRRGGRVFGICGGYQMLGARVSDPDGVEGPPGGMAGLGLLDIETVLNGAKTLAEISGTSLPDGAPFHGYEMHVGRPPRPACANPLLRFDDGRLDGARSADGLIRAAYVHGLFADDRQRGALLSYEAEIDRVLDALARHLAHHIDLDRLIMIAR